MIRSIAKCVYKKDEPVKFKVAATTDYDSVLLTLKKEKRWSPTRR
ncbi:MAG: hypothetical protein R3C24_02545 [Cyanobacteriota/Melainabacteria group bacterium]